VTMPQIVLSDTGSLGTKVAVARPRSMAPKEHGTWGQLVIPLVVALGLGKPTPGRLGTCLGCGEAAAAALLFWLVVAGCRAMRPTPKSLRRVGWILVGASVAQAVWLLVALRVWG